MYCGASPRIRYLSGRGLAESLFQSSIHLATLSRSVFSRTTEGYDVTKSLIMFQHFHDSGTYPRRCKNILFLKT